MQYYLPVVVVIVVNTLYHICAKAVPQHVNALALLTVTYLISAVVALALFFVTAPGVNFFTEVKQINWAPIVLGFALVGLEFGFILIYRVGWNISVASLVCNIGIAIVLIILGVLIYKEHMNMNQMVGIVLCIAGLIFINK